MATSPSAAPIGATFGALISGIDLSRQLDDGTIGWIRTQLARHAVLVFKDQRLDAPQLGAFGRRFGTPRAHFLEGFQNPDFPEVSFISNVGRDGKIDAFGVKRATIWHADETYKDVPPKLAILHGMEIPARGGGTLFADMRAAFDALPADMRARLRGLTGIHRFGAGPEQARAIYAGKLTAEQEKDCFHPAVVRHPESGRDVLFVNPGHACGFVGVDPAEGFELVRALGAHAIQDRFVYHHRWEVGDVVMWDEVATMHKGAGDYAPDERRVLIRTIVQPGPGEPALAAAA